MPNYIKYTPQGQDLTKGMAQLNLCHTITRYMIDTDANNASNPRIIGLCGKWGSGKSNVIKLLKDSAELNDDYHFFEYDTWGHQEDSMRQSLMESITIDLTAGDSPILPQELTIEGQKITWKKYLTQILSQKSRQDNPYYPQLPDSLKWLILTFLASTFINLFIAYFDDNIITHFTRLVLTSTLWIAYGIYFLCIRDSFDHLLLLFEKNYRAGQTISALYTHQPSAIDFREWMQSINNHANKKIVIVLDNMDRLPQQKVMRLWSTIHTFFACDGFPNVWVIIPYDEEHLYKALGADVAESYINKTIPVTFRVPMPIIADFRALFDTFYQQAFGTDDPSQDTVRHLYDSTGNKTVRDLISFLNKAVTYKLQFPDIETIHIAIYLIEEKHMNGNTNKLLSKEFEKKYQLYVAINDSTILSIARLIYGLDAENAEQVLIEDVLNHTLEGVSDDILQKTVMRKNFFDVADHYFSVFDPQTFDSDIHVLADIEKFVPQAHLPQMTSIWHAAINYYQNEPTFWLNPINDFYFIILIKHASPNAYKNLLQQYYTSLKDERGGELFRISKALTEAIPTLVLTEILQPKVIPVKSYIEYVNAAKSEFEKYPITCNYEELMKELINTGIDQITTPELFLSLKKYGGDGYEALYKHIKQCVCDSPYNPQFFAHALPLYRVLSPIPVPEIPKFPRIQTVQRQMHSISHPDISVDIQALMIAHDRLPEISKDKLNEVIPVLVHYLSPEQIFIRSIHKRSNYYRHITDMVIHLHLYPDNAPQADINKIKEDLVKNDIVSLKDIDAYIEGWKQYAKDHHLLANRTYTY